MIHRIIDRVFGVQVQFTDDWEWTWSLKENGRSLKSIASIQSIRNEDEPDVTFLDVIVGPILIVISWEKVEK